MNIVEVKIDDEQKRKVMGKKLIRYGIENSINEVSVNEQNSQAVGFLKHMGLE